MSLHQHATPPNPPPFLLLLFPFFFSLVFLLFSFSRGQCWYQLVEGEGIFRDGLVVGVRDDVDDALEAVQVERVLVHTLLRALHLVLQRHLPGRDGWIEFLDEKRAWCRRGGNEGGREGGMEGGKDVLTE